MYALLCPGKQKQLLILQYFFNITFCTVEENRLMKDKASFVPISDHIKVFPNPQKKNKIEEVKSSLLFLLRIQPIFNKEN